LVGRNCHCGCRNARKTRRIRVCPRVTRRRSRRDRILRNRPAKPVSCSLSRTREYRELCRILEKTLSQVEEIAQ
jgi:hypothetical protein